VLLVGTRSGGWLALAVALLTIVPFFVGRTSIVTLAVSPCPSSARLHVIRVVVYVLSETHAAVASRPGRRLHVPGQLAVGRTR
jgi:hypothetical protein